jgi:hypothetical protein
MLPARDGKKISNFKVEGNANDLKGVALKPVDRISEAMNEID